MATVKQSMAMPAAVRSKLHEVRRRGLIVRLLAGGIATLAVFLLAMMTAMLADWMFTLFSPGVRLGLTLTALGAAGVMLVLVVLRPLLRPDDLARVADQVDRAVPHLEERWSTVAEISSSSDRPDMLGSPSMIRQVTHEAESMHELVDPERVVSKAIIKQGLYGLGAAAAVLLLAFLVDASQTWVLVQRFFAPRAEISLTGVESLTADVVVPRAEALVIDARLTHRHRDSATLFLRTGNGDVSTVPLLPAAKDDLQFSHKIESVDQSFAYRIRSGDGQTPWHAVTAVDRPNLESITLRIVPPAYSGLPEVSQPSLPRRIKALEGSRLELSFTANQPLQNLQLKFDEQTTVDLSPAGKGSSYTYKTVLEESIAFSPVLVNEHGLANQRPPHCVIVVYPDRAPTVKVVTPDDEISVRPDDRITVEFEAADDFGIARAELAVFAGGASGESKELETIEIPLGEQQGKTSVTAAAELDLKKFDAKHGAELSYVVRVFDTKRSSAAGSPSESNSGTASSQPSSQNQSQQSTDAQLAQASQSSAGQNPQSGQGDAQSDEQNPETNDAAQNSKASPADPADSHQDDTRTAQTSSEQSSSASNTQANAASSKPQDKQSPAAELTGAPRSQDNMTRRMLDTGQCTACKAKRIHINEWAGSFAGQAREKLQLAIDPRLKQLDALLQQAEQHAAQLLEHLDDTQPWAEAQSTVLHDADDRLDAAEKVIVELRDKSAGSPYAFIGLQLVEIAQSHISPAREHLGMAEQNLASEKRDPISTAHYHVGRARELLARLTRQYEAAKLNEKLADEMLRIKKMHQLFLEGTFALLGSKKPSLNPKERSFVELEFDDDFLIKLRELLEKKRDIQAELARILAEDPRLLARFMARTRLEADSLRDQLTLLARRQNELHDEVVAWHKHASEQAESSARGDSRETASGNAPSESAAAPSQSGAETKRAEKQQPTSAPPAGIATADSEPNADSPDVMAKIRARQLSNALEIAEAAAQMYDNFVTWTPLDLDPAEGTLAEFRKQAADIASTASRFATEAAGDDRDSSAEQAQHFYEQLKQFEQQLPSAAIDGHDKLAVHVANRLMEAGKLITLTSGWIRKAEKIRTGEYHLAAEVDQHGLSVDTAELNSKLDNLESQLAGMPEDILALASELKHTLEHGVAIEQLAAETSLGRNDVPVALEHQQETITAFALAESQFDMLLDEIIRHLDSQPVGEPNIDNAQVQSLEDLLAMLEDEARACEGLGIPCCRPTNLQIVKDWLQPGNQSGQGGQGGQGAGTMAAAAAAQSSLAQQQTDRLRNEFQAMLERLSEPSRQDGKDGIGTPGTRWNTLASQLEDALRQGRGNIPPKRYRRAIEQYFDLISEGLPTSDDQTE